ncbi:hypothetical protein SELMODRAFT_411385 [Selaginella moellendorffii]|uniref:Uncharacterized protein n=1 Tax=Selaginella moellendorffii TaxID=88036 RepID=D8RHG8_SELML|nr:hypothetical protein SELMODRAFT_411385 [Selaginella moellendorffii]
MPRTGTSESTFREMHAPDPVTWNTLYTQMPGYGMDALDLSKTMKLLLYGGFAMCGLGELYGIAAAKEHSTTTNLSSAAEVLILVLDENVDTTSAFLFAPITLAPSEAVAYLSSTTLCEISLAAVPRSTGRSSMTTQQENMSIEAYLGARSGKVSSASAEISDLHFIPQRGAHRRASARLVSGSP